MSDECIQALSPPVRARWIEQHGERGRKALQAVEERRVKKYLDFFVVVGYQDEYVVDDDFCTCRDFLFRGRVCSHILAVRLARSSGQYEEYSSWYYTTLY